MAGKGKDGIRKGRNLTRLEEQLWKTAMRDVRPSPAPADSGQDGIQADVFLEAMAAPMQVDAPLSAAGRLPPVVVPGRVVFGLGTAGIAAQAKSSSVKGAGVDRDTGRKLARGQMTIDAKLDLHGMRFDQAKYALQRFIDTAYHAQKRCVLVITGQGSARGNRQGAPATKSNDQPWYEPAPGVLKRHLPEWLAEPALAAKIIAVEPAQQRHGGAGACYVLLRRVRP